MWNFMLFWKIIDNKYILLIQKKIMKQFHIFLYTALYTCLFWLLLVTSDRFVYKYMINPGDSRLKRSSDL